VIASFDGGSDSRKIYDKLLEILPSATAMIITVDDETEKYIIALLD
jgi:hypothetical protein